MPKTAQTAPIPSPEPKPARATSTSTNGKITDEQKAAIRALRADGLSTRQVATQVGVSQATVRKYGTTNGAAPEPEPTPSEPTPELPEPISLSPEQEQLVTMLRQNIPLREIGKEFGVRASEIRARVMALPEGLHLTDAHAVRAVRGTTVSKYPPLAPAGETLADDLREWFESHVVLDFEHGNHEAVALALWTLHTWPFDAFEATPYLLIKAPVPEAGKTMLMKVVKPLARDSQMAARMSPAAMARHTHVRHTLLLDEADEMQQDREIRAILNSGYDSDGKVEVADGSGDATREYRTFSPKCFAGIAGKRMPIEGATLTRCVILPIQPKLTEERTASLDSPESVKEARRLRSECQSFGAQAIEDLADQWGLPKDMPTGVKPRWHQVWTPLIRIADYLGPRWAALGRDACQTLATLAPGAVSENTAFIHDLFHALVDMGFPDQEHSEVLVSKIDSLPNRLSEQSLRTPKKLSGMMARFDLRPEPQPFAIGGLIARGYRFEPGERIYDRLLRNVPEARYGALVHGKRSGVPMLPMKFWPEAHRESFLGAQDKTTAAKLRRELAKT